MRHNKSGRKLNRSTQHRKALFSNMANAIIAYGKIRTTEAKAKELRRVIEPLVTLGKRNDLHSRRLAYKVLGSHDMVKKLFDEIAPRYAGVPGGYTRVVKLGMPRKGDAAPLAIIEFVGQEGVAESKSVAKAKAEGVAKVKAALKPAAAKPASAKPAAAKPAAAKAAASKAPKAPKVASPAKKKAKAEE